MCIKEKVQNIIIGIVVTLAKSMSDSGEIKSNEIRVPYTFNDLSLEYEPQKDNIYVCIDSKQMCSISAKQLDSRCIQNKNLEYEIKRQI